MLYFLFGDATHEIQDSHVSACGALHILGLKYQSNIYQNKAHSRTETYFFIAAHRSADQSRTYSDPQEHKNEFSYLGGCEERGELRTQQQQQQ